MIYWKKPLRFLFTCLAILSFLFSFLPKTASAEELCLEPVDVCLLIDASGSMALEGRMFAAQEAAKIFLDYLGQNDQSAAGYFNSLASVNKLLSTEHNLTAQAIDNLWPNGGTNIGEGIAQALTELTSTRANQEANQVIILLSDGAANLPGSIVLGEAYAQEKAHQAAGESIQIFTVGLGSEINEQMLYYIAQITSAHKANGEAGYYPAPSPDDLLDIYQEIAYDICQPELFCGDGLVSSEIGEVCEIGQPTACQTDQSYQGLQTCAADCLTWSQCQASEFCGDSIKNGPEQCDGQDSLIGGYFCDSQCQLLPLPALTACSDNLDNDSDGLIDSFDPAAGLILLIS